MGVANRVARRSLRVASKADKMEAEELADKKWQKSWERRRKSVRRVDKGQVVIVNEKLIHLVE